MDQQERFRAAFTEWDRLYREEPDEFQAEWPSAEDYGQAAARYFVTLLGQQMPDPGLTEDDRYSVRHGLFTFLTAEAAMKPEAAKVELMALEAEAVALSRQPLPQVALAGPPGFGTFVVEPGNMGLDPRYFNKVLKEMLDQAIQQAAEEADQAVAEHGWLVDRQHEGSIMQVAAWAYALGLAGGVPND